MPRPTTSCDHVSRVTLCAGLLSVVVIAATAAASDVSVSARLDQSQVAVGNAVGLSVEVNGAQNAPAPALASPDGLSIRYAGPSTQVSIVNGQFSASVTHRYSITALKAGTFTIGPIRLEFGGQQYDAGSVTLQALAAGAPRGHGAAAAPSGEALRLVLSTPKTELYLYERVPLSLKLYVGNVRVSDLQYPTVLGDGFAVEKFPEPAQRREQTAQGVFQVVDFATTLTPLRSGGLTVGPAKMGLSVVTRRHGGDPFFEQFFGGSQKPVELQSEPLNLTILALPEAGKPEGFAGAVGRFQFAVKAAPLDVQVGDPVTITMTVQGAGNIENATSPAIAGSDALRVYPAQTQPAPNAQTKVFEQVVIPQQPGTVTLPEAFDFLPE